MLILKLAWRNLWRHKRRSVLTLAAIAFASAVLMFFLSLQFSSYDTAIDASTRLLHGHMQIQAPGYLERPQMENTIVDFDQILSRTNAVDEIEISSARAYSFALLSSEDRTFGAQVIGVQPRTETLVSSLTARIIAGDYLEATDTYAAVIGSALARNLKANPGTEITLLGQGKDGSLAATVLTVKGIFESGNNELDRGILQLPLNTFQEVFALDNEAHAIIIRLSHIRHLELVKNELKSLAFENVTVLSWDEIIPGLREAINLDMASGRLFHLCLIVVVVFSIINTFLMSVLERFKEFGIMLALGTTPWSLARLILLESFFLGVVGIIIGAYFGWAIVAYYGTHGFTVPGMEEVAKLWNLPARIYTRLTLDVFLQGPLLLLFATVFAALYPALKTLKVIPHEAIRT